MSSSSNAWPPAIWSDDRKMGFYFGPIITADEEEREQKLAFWRDAFFTYQRHQQQPQPAAASSSSSSTRPTKFESPNTDNAHHHNNNSTASSSSHHHVPPSRPSLSFTLQEVQKGMARRGEISLALETVLCQLLASNEIRLVDHYSSSSTPKKSAAAAVTNYLMSWISPKKVSTTGGKKLPPGRYVLVEQVESAANELIQILKQQDTDVFTLEQLEELTGRSSSDIVLLIHHLQLQGQPPLLTEAFPAAQEQVTLSAAPAHERVFKFGSSPVTAADHSRAILGIMIKAMRAKTREKEEYINERERDARRLLAAKRKPLALIQLQMKQRCLTQLHQLHSQLENLDILLHHLEQSISQQELMACMKQANQTLKQMQRSPEASDVLCNLFSIRVEELSDLNDDLSESLAQVKLVDEALAQPVLGGDVDVEAEYAHMLAEIEREKTEEQQKSSSSSSSLASPTKSEPTTINLNINITSPPPVSSSTTQPNKKMTTSTANVKPTTLKS